MRVIQTSIKKRTIRIYLIKGEILLLNFHLSLGNI